MKRPLEYTKNSANALKFSLVEDLDENDFNIVAREQKRYGDISIGAMITGASHIIAFEIEGKKYYEVFSREEVKSSSKRVYYGALDMLLKNNDRKFKVGDIEYRFSVGLQGWNSYESALKQLEKVVGAAEEAGSIGLSFEYPVTRIDDMKKPPKSLCHVEANRHKRIITVYTMHCYPNEDRIVSTNTVIKY